MVGSRGVLHSARGHLIRAGPCAQGWWSSPVNYRLGVSGLSLPSSCPRRRPPTSRLNYAFLDQIAALTWVRKRLRPLASITSPGQPSSGSPPIVDRPTTWFATRFLHFLFHVPSYESWLHFSVHHHSHPSREALRQFAQAAVASSFSALPGDGPASAVTRVDRLYTSATVDGWSLSRMTS